MILLITAFDQLTKFLAVKYLKGNEPVDFIKGIVRFNYSENTGMAFSMLSGARWLFVVLTVIVCAGILWYLFSNRAKHLWLYWSLGVVCAGGIGNLIDRLWLGYVRDFLRFDFITFPIFNVADVALVTGVIMLIVNIVIWFVRSEMKARAEKAAKNATRIHQNIFKRATARTNKT